LTSCRRNAAGSSGLIVTLPADDTRGSGAEPCLAIGIRPACKAIACCLPCAEACLTSCPEAKSINVALIGSFVSTNAKVLIWSAAPLVVRHAKRLFVFALASLLFLADTGTTLQNRAVATVANIEAAKGICLGLVLVPVLSPPTLATLVVALGLTPNGETAPDDARESYTQSCAAGKRGRALGQRVDYCRGHRFLPESDGGDASRGYVPVSTE
jgi:hypothetical protein